MIKPSGDIDFKTADGDDWDSHWQDYEVAAAKNPAQRLRRRFVTSQVERLRPESLIDVGCGTGELLEALRCAGSASRLAGVETSYEGARLTRRRIPDSDVRTFDVLCDIPADWRNSFAMATSMEVLEHVDDPQLLCEGMLNLLIPGGYLLVTVPGGKMSAFYRHIGHRQHFSPRDLEEMMKSAGYRDVMSWTIGFPAMNAYRWVVRKRGDRLIEDARSSPNVVATTAMGIFDVAMKSLAFDTATRGVQTVGIGVA